MKEYSKEKRLEVKVDDNSEEFKKIQTLLKPD